jgi:Tfp pilus assembly protein PilN
LNANVIEHLNLAGQPFRNRTLPWTLAAVIALVSAAALLFTFGEYRRTRERAAAVEQDVRGLRTERDNLRAQAETVNNMLTDEQRRTLEAAHLITGRKNFSWSQLLADLEATLPPSVKVSRITVRDIDAAGGRTRADLELAVVGRSPADVNRLIADLARAGLFGADLLTMTPETRGGSGVEATLRVRYLPRAGRPAGAPPADNSAGQLSGAAGERAEAR